MGGQFRAPDRSQAQAAGPARSGQPAHRLSGFRLGFQQISPSDAQDVASAVSRPRPEYQAMSEERGEAVSARNPGPEDQPEPTREPAPTPEPVPLPEPGPPPVPEPTPEREPADSPPE
jgi:DNA polymerase-3 subunit gamma/tau